MLNVVSMDTLLLLLMMLLTVVVVIIILVRLSSITYTQQTYR